MKKILVLFLALVLVLLLVACDTSPLNEPDTEPDSTQEETEPTDTTQEYLGWEDIVLEPDKQDLPSYEDFSKINYDMTYDDVYEILGNPQRMILKKVSQGSGMVIRFYSYCCVYEGSEDWLLYVAYGTSEVNKNLRIRYCAILKEEIFLLTAEEALTHLREGMTYGEVSTKLGQHYRCQYNTNETVLEWLLADDQVLYVYFQNIEDINLIRYNTLSRVNEWIVTSFKIEENKSTTP